MTLDDLRFDPIRHSYPQRRLFAFSGRGSTGIVPNTVTGLGAFFFPPVAAKDFRFFHRLHLPDFCATLGDSSEGTHYTPHRIMLQEIDWLPWRIRRRGIFHHHVGKKLVTLQVEHETIAPADCDGVLVKLTLQSPAALRVDVRPEMQNAAEAFGVCADTAWNYEVPAATGIVWSEGPHVWRTDGCTMRLLADDWSVKLTAGQPVTLWFALSLEGNGLKPVNGSIARHAAAAEKYWRDLWTKRPVVENHERLFYRCWLTTMTCRWLRENFIAQPYYSTSGIDGGALCCYLWDLSYTSKLIAGIDTLGPLVKRLAHPEKIFTGYSISPTNGEWLGVFYAFSPYSLVKILADAGVKLPVAEKILLEFDRRYRSRAGILDFGNNRHLIELHTAGYEGIVPNPNFEHAWSLMPVNPTRAKKLLRACDRLFWNEREGWYFPASQEKVWSVQILSALRLGVFPRDRVARMATHFRDGRFLGPYGIYSIAQDDHLHFTLNDADWGGGGCYTGHTGIILEGFARYGMNDVVERILERIDWWGDRLPYVPQSTLSTAPECHGRSNLVAAGAVCQALLALR